jgi:hypothetical protein
METELCVTPGTAFASSSDAGDDGVVLFSIGAGEKELQSLFVTCRGSTRANVKILCYIYHFIVQSYALGRD